jgi:hypothetical protein
VNNLPYLGFGGGVLARLKGERRQALQGNIPFVILTDLNLEAIKNNNKQILKKICHGFGKENLTYELPSSKAVSETTNR